MIKNCLTWYTFAELTAAQLYAILKLRSEVFVVEQNCVYLDPDGIDIDAMHLVMMEDQELAAYLRLLPPTSSANYLVFGRVLTSPSVRGKGYGKQLIQALLTYCQQTFFGVSIKCSAQAHLQHFYQEFGFKVYGEPYEEDGIPHIGMQKND